MNAWVDLQLRANEVLRRSASFDRTTLRRVLHIIEQQASGTAYSWEVLSDDAVRHPYDPYLIVARTWESDKDYPKFISWNDVYLDLDDPAFAAVIAKLVPREPTIETQEFTIAALAVDSVLGWITSLRFAMPRDRGAVGWDGASYELSIGDLLTGVSFSWWADGPPEWRELTQPMLNLLGRIREEAGARVQSE
jgi:hypothetical protein